MWQIDRVPGLAARERFGLMTFNSRNSLLINSAAGTLSSKPGHTILHLNDQFIQQCLKEISIVDLTGIPKFIPQIKFPVV